MLYQVIERGVAVEKINKVSIIGLGAIGAAYASRLYDLNPNCIQVIADSERILRYQNSNLIVNGCSYEFQYISPETETDPADLLLIAVKYDGLEQAIKDVKHHVGPNTIIMSLLNGISSEDIIAKAYGGKNLLYAMCIAIDAIRDGLNGREVHFTSIGRICYGEKTNLTYSPNVLLVKDLFERACIPYEIPENMERAMWKKFMINVGINQSSAVLRAPYHLFQNEQDAHDLMVSAMQEVILLSEQAGTNLTRNDIEEFDTILRELSPKGKTSMLQDIEAGRKTEVEYFAGKVCELGNAFGIATPVNETLYRIIRTIEHVR